jgi:hypothetical protein
MLTGGDGVVISFEKMERDQRLFAGDLLASWYDMNGLWDKPNALLFPSSHKGAGGKEKTWSKQWFRQRVKRSVAMIGLDPEQYSGHSFRAGGATELFVRRVPYHIIKKFGRWKSDAAMLYYRDQDDVNRVVGRAFGVAEMKVGRSWPAGVSRSKVGGGRAMDLAKAISAKPDLAKRAKTQLNIGVITSRV